MRKRDLPILAGAFFLGFAVTQPLGCWEASVFCPPDVECRASGCDSVLFTWDGQAPWGLIGGAIAALIALVILQGQEIWRRRAASRRP